jgi:hypothetical protein
LAPCKSFAVGITERKALPMVRLMFP